ETLDIRDEEPIFGKMVSFGYQGGAVLGTFSLRDTAVINSYLRMPQVRSLLSGDQCYAKFVWGKPIVNKSTREQFTEPYALKYNRERIPPLSGSVVTEATQTYDQRGNPAVSMQIDGKGAKIWEEMTGYASTHQSSIAILLDDIIYS